MHIYVGEVGTMPAQLAGTKLTKVFCFFFSKKKRLLFSEWDRAGRWRVSGLLRLRLRRARNDDFAGGD
jgi:hypothetical protein